VLFRICTTGPGLLLRQLFNSGLALEKQRREGNRSTSNSNKGSPRAQELPEEEA